MVGGLPGGGGGEGGWTIFGDLSSYIVNLGAGRYKIKFAHKPIDP